MLTIEEKLAIANAGGKFEEDRFNWMGALIKKGDKFGEVIEEDKGMFRILTVKFQDLSQEKIRMNNVGPDPESVHDFEWYSCWLQKWCRF